MQDKKRIGHRLAVARQLAHLTQEQASERIGVSANALKLWEWGRRVPSTRAHWDAVVRTYNRPLGWFIGEEVLDA